ncbi:MAG: PAS domain-containing protein [Anaerolineae bacterium]|nr:PAS domain-containing protein [Anaerolineae bacterium]
MVEMTRIPAYEFVFRSSSDGILIADAERIITAINPAASAMLGVLAEDATGQQAVEVFAQNPALINLFERSGDQTLEVRLPKRRLALGIASTLGDGQRMVLLQDITEQQEMDTRREALVTAMAHDLRNPLAAVGGFADLVEKSGPLTAQQEKFLTRIRQTAMKLYEVAGSLVDLAWIEAGMPLVRRPVQLDGAIERVVRQLEDMAQEKKITIALSVQKPLPTVMGDPSRLQLVIHHLVHNALLYSPSEQTVAVHSWGDDHEVYFSVADRGIGISDEEIELVFDRLYRSRDDRVREMPGGGLGLTIARTIITRHGGDIWASSNLGVGSTFTFVLPVHR